jgi:hypothetical protein
MWPNVILLTPVRVGTRTTSRYVLGVKKRDTMVYVNLYHFLLQLCSKGTRAQERQHETKPRKHKTGNSRIIVGDAKTY